ncbi:PAS domain-containing protein [Haloterrigena salifodinae]|uniref:histidine kinase n=1 Tax=Haloterrigena salifodinae TaxID=2675099 RepID=A0A8T8DYC3_9EURY|nr:ATP-binding protein [Haloterrigena salifodinae]QRV14505.1 PAS domain-containing protein [Haloterrigena salifodinae]
MGDDGSPSGSQENLTDELERRNRFLQQVSEIISDTDQPFLDQIDSLLETGRDAVGTEFAAFSFVDDDACVFEAIDVPNGADIQRGDAVPLPEVPKSKRVVETEQTLVLGDVEAQATELADPWGIDCYLGAPIFNADEVYGTFCLCGTEARSEGFSDWEETFIELLSNWVSTQLQQREQYQSLRDTQLQMEAAVDAGAVGTWEWNIPEDQFVTGPSFARTFGVDPDKASKGVPLQELLDSIHEGDRDRVTREIEDAVESCGEYEAEYRVWNADDELQWVIARGYVECDDDGNPLTFPGALTDITDQKQAERQLETVNGRLRASNKRLEQFAHAASHDLQEPLRMVSSYLQLIENQYGETLDEEGREFLEFAVDGAERMRNMIDALLAYSRVETQGSPFEPVDLNDVLMDVQTDLQRKIEETEAEVTVTDLPRVEGDPSQLRQLFQNLLDNALEYSGDEPPRVYVSAEQGRSKGVIAVRDEGIGIEPANHDQIFEVFERLHSREDHSGTGIGLSLCERIAERHDGEMWVESEPENGTTVFVSLPIYDA